MRNPGMDIDEILASARSYEWRRKEGHSATEMRPETAGASRNMKARARKARSSKKNGAMKQAEGSSAEDARQQSQTHPKAYEGICLEAYGRHAQEKMVDKSRNAHTPRRTNANGAHS